MQRLRPNCTSGLPLLFALLELLQSQGSQTGQTSLTLRYYCLQVMLLHRIAYSPLLIRLACGATADRPLGHWEIHGLGLMGVYKSDWDKVGGMNVNEFKNKWGGEDWEMSDRILEAGMEIERLKMLHFFHYLHSKKRHVD